MAGVTECESERCEVAGTLDHALPDARFDDFAAARGIVFAMVRAR